jgi:hypothetical protein
VCAAGARFRVHRRRSDLVCAGGARIQPFEARNRSIVRPEYPPGGTPAGTDGIVRYEHTPGRHSRRNRRNGALRAHTGGTPAGNVRREHTPGGNPAGTAGIVRREHTPGGSARVKPRPAREPVI